MKLFILTTVIALPFIACAAPANYQAQALATHNKLRALHHVPNLVWDKTLESFALNYARKCRFQHSGSPYGENLARGYPTVASAITKGWYAEGAHYSYRNPGFSMGTGHFTQLIWKSTRRVGCGFVACNGKNGLHGNYLVCEYSPPGNILNAGFFQANVLPIKYINGDR